MELAYAGHVKGKNKSRVPFAKVEKSVYRVMEQEPIRVRTARGMVNVLSATMVGIRAMNATEKVR